MSAETRFPMVSVSYRREPVDMGRDVMVRVEDQEWRYVDKTGHLHAWQGKKLPTLKRVKTGTEWVGDEFDGEEYDVFVWHCRLCKEVVEPGYKSVPAPVVMGPTYVDVELGGERFEDLTVEEYSESVAAWAGALRKVRPPTTLRFGKTGDLL